MLFDDIGSIIKKLTKLDDDNKPQEKYPIASISKDTQAFKLFSEGKKPIEVAIKLDLGADVVDRLYQQFWKLEGLYQLNQVYKDIRRHLPSFLKLFRLREQQRIMSEQDVVEALKFGKELPQLKDQFHLLIEEIDSLEYRRNSLRTALSALQNQISTTKD
jgi:DnaJ-domain-containing protein 1